MGGSDVKRKNLLERVSEMSMGRRGWRLMSGGRVMHTRRFLFLLSVTYGGLRMPVSRADIV